MCERVAGTSCSVDVRLLDLSVLLLTDVYIRHPDLEVLPSAIASNFSQLMCTHSSQGYPRCLIERTMGSNISPSAAPAAVLFLQLDPPFMTMNGKHVALRTR